MERRQKADALQNFIEACGADVLRFCIIVTESREEGRDLYQETLLTILSKAPAFESMEKEKSYALSVAVFLWKKEKKKFAVRRRIAPTDSLEKMTEEAGEDRVPDRGPTPEEEALKAAEAEAVRAAVIALPEKYRIPVELFYAADASLQEIANILHIPVATVKTRLRRAKEQLKKALEGEFDDR